MTEERTETHGGGGKLAADARLRRRHRAERRFRGICIGALLLAGAFLVLFLGSMVVAAYPAFTQTEV
jgi:phosphate transport system permease protein